MSTYITPQSIEESSVLFALNDSEDLKRLGNILEFRTLQLKNCSNEDRALQLIKAKKPDLIILDKRFSNLDTFQLCRQLKEQNDSHDIPIVFLVDNNENSTAIQELFEAGGTDYISKPFHDNEIKSKAKTLIELKKMREAVPELTKTDPLTNLPNRQGAEATIAYEFQRSKRINLPYSIIIGEIDNSSSIRKSHGTDTVEAVLKGVAGFISKSIRDQDTLARWKEEQFLLLLPQTDRRGVVALAEKLRSNLEQHRMRLGNGEQTVTMTCGVTSCTGKKPYTQCLAKAAKALEDAKKNGRNCTLYGF